MPVVIKNAETLHEALDLFVEPEILDGDNKYQCDKCEKKCAALKGLQFKRLPYLLTVQLKRFDIDFQLVCPYLLRFGHLFVLDGTCEDQ